MKYKKAQNSSVTFSSKMRELRKNNPELVLSFLKKFKNAFEQACDENVENIEQTALLQTNYINE